MNIQEGVDHDTAASIAQEVHPWASREKLSACVTRKNEIDQQLRGMGADHAYCMRYFQSGAGTCELLVGGRCKKHRACAAPLPRGKVCALEFGGMVTDLRRKIGEVEAERRRLRREWEHLRILQSAEGFMADAGDKQVQTKN